MEIFEKQNDFCIYSFHDKYRGDRYCGKNIHIKTNRQEYFSPNSYFYFIPNASVNIKK